MALKCEECSSKLIFSGGVKVGRTDLEIHKCNYCNQYYSYDFLKGKLSKWNVKVWEDKL